MSEPREMVVAGAGPAGLLAAVALAERGLPVRVIAPAPEARWANRYACWRDEWPAWLSSSALDLVWPRARVWLDDDVDLDLDRAYARVDGDALQRALLSRLRAAGGALEVGVVRAHAQGGAHTELTTEGGATRSCGALVDASGARSTLTRRAGSARAFQTAYGVELELPPAGRHPFDPRQMWLFDLRHSEGASFLYALPVGPRRVFVEETALVASPAVDIDVLKGRLQRRLAALGLDGARGDAGEERCFIAMDLPPPALDQPTLAFGAAAAMVHPATGYQLAYAAERAPGWADAVAAVWAGGGTSEAMARAGWEALWPRDVRRAHALYGFGGELLAELELPQLRRFFAAFFSLPRHRWAAYLSRRADPSALRATMWAMYRAASPDLRARLRSAAARRPRQVAFGALGWPAPRGEPRT